MVTFPLVLMGATGNTTSGSVGRSGFLISTMEVVQGIVRVSGTIHDGVVSLVTWVSGDVLID